MPIKAKELIKESGVLEEVEDELAGIRQLSWDFTNFEDNVKFINSKMDVFFTHIQDDLMRLSKLEEGQNELEKKLEKLGEDLSDTPYYKLYEGSKLVRGILFRIIGYLSIQLDVLQTSVNNLVSLLKESKKYGLMKYKAESEIEILKTTRESLINMMDKLFKEITTTLQTIAKTLGEIKTSTIDLSPVERKLESLEIRLENLERRMEESRVEVRTTTPQVQVQTQQLVDDRMRKFNELRRLILEEGITDRAELARLLNMTPMQVSLLGYKDLVKQATQKEKEVKKEEEEVEEGEEE